MFTRLFIIFSDTRKIFSKRHLTLINKLRLFFAYCSVVLSRFLDGRFLDIKSKKFLSFKVYFKNYSDFYWTFREVFIEEEYYFKSNKKNPFIIDCGANIGLPVLYFKYMYPEAKIIAFEAEPDNFDFLKVNIVENNINNVEIINKAVARREGNLSFFGDGRAGSLIKSFVDSKEKIKKERREKMIIINTTPLSKYILGEKVDLLKMDIEGAEGEVFEDLFENKKLKMVNQIVMEYHYISPKVNRLSTILNFFEKSGLQATFNAGVITASEVCDRNFSHIMIFAKR